VETKSKKNGTNSSSTNRYYRERSFHLSQVAYLYLALSSVARVRKTEAEVCQGHAQTKAPAGQELGSLTQLHGSGGASLRGQACQHP